MGNEQRQNIRMKTFLRGRIIFNGGASSMDCLIRDLSASGARLEISESSALPEVFDLYVQNRDATHRATLRWRRDGGVGVTFDDAKSKSHPGSSMAEASSIDQAMSVLLRRISELEAENAALRSTLTGISQQQAPSAA